MNHSMSQATAPGPVTSHPMIMILRGVDSESAAGFSLRGDDGHCPGPGRDQRSKNRNRTRSAQVRSQQTLRGFKVAVKIATQPKYPSRFRRARPAVFKSTRSIPSQPTSLRPPSPLVLGLKPRAQSRYTPVALQSTSTFTMAEIFSPRSWVTDGDGAWGGNITIKDRSIMCIMRQYRHFIGI
jgi:hypothetical protein